MGLDIKSGILIALLIIVMATIITCVFVFVFKREKFLRALKILALVYFGWAFFRYMLSDSFIMVINDLFSDTSPVLIHTTEIAQSILRWGHYVSYIVLPMAVFFDSRLFKKIAVYFCAPFAIVSAVFFKDFMAYFMTATERNSIMGPLWFREVYFAAELVLAIAIPLMIIFKDYKSLKFSAKKEIIEFAVVLPFVILALIPVYTPQSLIGLTKFNIESFTIGNIVWITITLAEIVALYTVFRFKTYRERYMLCMFLSLSLFMHYNSQFLMGFTLERLPIQLCNMGAYFCVLMLLIRKRAFFNFTFLANVMGTILAMIAPESSGGFAGFYNFHYIIEHMQLLVIPLLCMLLRIFPRLSKRALKHLVIGFSAYFLFCFLIGTLLNGFTDMHGQARVNYFFMFDIQIATQILPFLRFSGDFEWILFNRFYIYPVFQIIIFAGFLALCVLLYLLVIKLYDILDDHFELRRARIALYEKKTGRTYKWPKEYPDDSEYNKRWRFF